jgi:hypothetical protein
MRRLLGLPSEVVRAAARVLLLTLSVTTVGPVLHESHDEDLQTVVGPHDESQHHLQAAPTSPDGNAPHHCLGCHFVRAPHGPVSWVAAGLAALESGDRLAHSDGLLVGGTFASPRPARAPPVHA